MIVEQTKGEIHYNFILPNSLDKKEDYWDEEEDLDYYDDDDDEYDDPLVYFRKINELLSWGFFYVDG